VYQINVCGLWYIVFQYRRSSLLLIAQCSVAFAQPDNNQPANQHSLHLYLDSYSQAPVCYRRYACFVASVAASNHTRIMYIVALIMASYGIGPAIIFLWSPYVIGQTIIFSSCFFLSSFFLLFFLAYLSGRRLDVYHTLAHGVALARI